MSLVRNFWQQTRLLRWPFWVANVMEMIERLAYYGVRVVIPIYIAQADEIGGLHFTQADKGFIFMWWALVQSILPVFMKKMDAPDNKRFYSKILRIIF